MRAVVGLIVLFLPVLLISSPASSRMEITFIEKILVDPKKYKDKKVKIVGYMENVLGANFLYPSKFDALVDDFSKRIAVFDEKYAEWSAQNYGCDRGYVEVIGIFGQTPMPGTIGIYEVKIIDSIYLSDKSARRVKCYRRDD